MSQVKWQRKIPHIDELEEEEVQKLLGLVEVSEKIDGQNLSFGLDAEGEFFTKTKRGTPAYDASVHTDVPYLEGFERFHRSLEDVETRHWTTPVSESNFQIFAELLPYPHTNTVKYDPDFFDDDGALVLFDLFIDGERPEDHLFRLKHLASELTSHTDFTVLRKSADFMECDTLNELHQRLKSEDSILGAGEPEGYVVRNTENDAIAKVVDKSRFTEENEDMHRFSNAMEDANRNLKVEVRQQVFDNADVLTNKSKTREKVVEELAARRESGFDDPSEVFEAIIHDLDSEGHVKPFMKCLEIYTDCVSSWIKDATLAKRGFLDSNAEIMGEIPTAVAEHKIKHGWTRVMNYTKTFMVEESLIPLVKIALGPTRTHWLQEEFVE